MPTRFDLSLHPTDLSHHLLIEISSKALSPTVPHIENPWTLASIISYPFQPRSASDSLNGLSSDRGYWKTDFEIIIEPLVFRFLPRGTAFALASIILFGMGAACCVPIVINSLEAIQEEHSTKMYKKVA